MLPIDLSSDSLEFLAFLTAELTVIYLVVVCLVELIQRRLGPARLQRMLGTEAGPKQFLVASALGAVTPFCSCSTVPIVAGMNRAGVPWPTLGSFLVISPLVNPALFSVIWAFVGVGYAALYVVASILVAMVVGLVIAKAGWTIDADAVDAIEPDATEPEDGSNLRAAWDESVASTVRLFPIFLGAGLIGTALRFWVGTGWIEGVLAQTGWWAVPVAAIVGIPVYASTAVLLPLGALLLDQGVGLGIVTAFLMGATGFSVPEGVMLKEIIGTRRLAVLTVAFGVSVVAAGYGFHLLGV